MTKIYHLVPFVRIYNGEDINYRINLPAPSEDHQIWRNNF